MLRRLLRLLAGLCRPHLVPRPKWPPALRAVLAAGAKAHAILLRAGAASMAANICAQNINQAPSRKRN